MQNTTHYNLKKPDYTDFADIQDINDNMDTIDAELAAPTGDGRDQTVSFTDADLDSGITSFPTFLTKIVSGMKLAKFLRDFKAGMAYVLHVGDLINNATCTESGKALDARMGKTLQDQITSLNDSLWEPVTVTTKLANPTTMTIVASKVTAFRYKQTGSICLFFTFTMKCSTDRGAGLGTMSFEYNGQPLYFNAPYRFFGVINGDDVVREILRQQNDLRYLSNPVLWTAGTEFRCSGVAIMELS